MQSLGGGRGAKTDYMFGCGSPTKMATRKLNCAFFSGFDDMSAEIMQAAPVYSNSENVG